jgi:hypothetical protein
MFPNTNDPFRPESWEDPDDYDQGPDIYDDEVLIAETRIHKELKTDPEYSEMNDGELSELAREFALEEVGNYDEWLARLKFMNEEP